MEFRDQAAKETSALIARLFNESAENSRQRLAAFRTAINNASKALETAIGSTPQFERELADLVNRLTKSASAESQAAVERVAAEGRIAADALRTELKAETKQKDALDAALKEARTRADALQAEHDAEKQRSDAARREVTDAREALKKVEAARIEAVEERDRDVKTRGTLEAEVQRLRQAIDTLRSEAASTSDQFESMIADKARLEEALAAAQSHIQATETKLAGVTTLFKQSSAKLKAFERDHEAAIEGMEASHAASTRELEATQAAALREMETTQAAALRQMETTQAAALREVEARHAAALRDKEASRDAAIDEALRHAERNHEAATRDLEAVHTAALREMEAKHAVLIHQIEAEHAAASRDAETVNSAAVRDLEARLHASAAGVASSDTVMSRVDALLDAFQALGVAATVGDVLATLLEHLAAEFSRVALFHVRGNRLEGSNQIGFEFDNDIAKLVFPLGLDSLLTRAVISGRIERVAGDEVADSGLAPFGGAPTCALAMPVVVQGDTLAIVYADDSGRSTSELSTRFASALLQHAVALLMRLNNDVRLLTELRGYATSLLTEVEEMYAADVASGKSGEDLQHRLKNNIDFARSIFATRIEAEGLDAAPLFEEELASLMDAQLETRFGRDLAVVAGRGEHHSSRKAEAS
jgi:hypothetical protein